MDLQEAVTKIANSWDKFEVKNRWDGGVANKMELDGLLAIWVHSTDHAGSYEVDEEWIGVTEDGRIAWAYASGCSCWDGGFEVEKLTPDTIKAFTFKHDDMKEEWEKKLIAFAETL